MLVYAIDAMGITLRQLRNAINRAEHNRIATKLTLKAPEPSSDRVQFDSSIYRSLLNLLSPCAHDWVLLARQLRIQNTKLLQIHSSKSDCGHCMMDVIEQATCTTEASGPLH